MRQPKWDKYETALLIEAYWEIKKKPAQKIEIIKKMSDCLRNRVTFLIDDTFRNVNGINMRLGELEYLFTSGRAGLKNTSNLFREMVDIYRNNKAEYETILMEAKKMTAISPDNHSQFCMWLQENVHDVDPDILCDLLAIGEDFCIKTKVLKAPLFHTFDVELIKQYVRTITNNKMFRLRYKKQHSEIVNAANLYYSYIQELSKLNLESPDELKSGDAENLSLDQITHEPVFAMTGDFEKDFYSWLKNVEQMAATTCRSYISALYSAESYAIDHGISPSTLCTIEEDTSLGVVERLMEDDDFLKYNKDQHRRFSASFQKLRKFLEFISQYSDSGVKHTPQNDNKKQRKKSTNTVSSVIVEELDQLLRNATEGISKKEICEYFQNYSTRQINLALEACHAVLILKKYHHRDNIVDYQQMADTILEVLSKQFSQNGNYTSAQQLYNEVRPRLDDFFFYNNAYDSRQEVFDLSVHLFHQEHYKGNSFIFMNNMHIWKVEPDYPKDYHGLLIKYARDHGNTFSREDAIEYFEYIGSTTPAQTFSFTLFNTGSRSFLQYDENQFVLREGLNINDYFMASVSTQIEQLLEGEDYIATGEIDDYFYSTLPNLPNGIYWSALLLEDILRIYDIGFTTIEAGADNDKKTLPAAIVRKQSSFRSFGDVVWKEISKSFSLPKEFTALEFREFLLYKGFIRGSEKVGNVHKTVAGDIRFYWTDNYGRVTIN